MNHNTESSQHKCNGGQSLSNLEVIEQLNGLLPFKLGQMLLKKYVSQTKSTTKNTQPLKKQNKNKTTYKPESTLSNFCTRACSLWVPSRLDSLGTIRASGPDGRQVLSGQEARLQQGSGPFLIKVLWAHPTSAGHLLFTSWKTLDDDRTLSSYVHFGLGKT